MLDVVLELAFIVALMWVDQLASVKKAAVGSGSHTHTTVNHRNILAVPFAFVQLPLICLAFRVQQKRACRNSE